MRDSGSLDVMLLLLSLLVETEFWCRVFGLHAFIYSWADYCGVDANAGPGSILASWNEDPLFVSTAGSPLHSFKYYQAFKSVVRNTHSVSTKLHSTTLPENRQSFVKVRFALSEPRT
jgi:hypothetical protein